MGVLGRGLSWRGGLGVREQPGSPAANAAQMAGLALAESVVYA